MATRRSWMIRTVLTLVLAVGAAREGRAAGIPDYQADLTALGEAYSTLIGQDVTADLSVRMMNQTVAIQVYARPGDDMGAMERAVCDSLAGRLRLRWSVTVSKPNEFRFMPSCEFNK